MVLGKMRPVAMEEEGQEGPMASMPAFPARIGWPDGKPRLAVLAVPFVLIGLLGTPWKQPLRNLLDPSEARDGRAVQFGATFLPLARRLGGSRSPGSPWRSLALPLHKLGSGHGRGGPLPRLKRLSGQTSGYLDDINDRISSKGSRKLARQVLGG